MFASLEGLEWLSVRPFWPARAESLIDIDTVSSKTAVGVRIGAEAGTDRGEGGESAGRIRGAIATMIAHHWCRASALRLFRAIDTKPKHQRLERPNDVVEKTQRSRSSRRLLSLGFFLDRTVSCLMRRLPQRQCPGPSRTGNLRPAGH